VGEGADNVVDRIRAGRIDVVVNTPEGSGPRSDGYEIRTAAVAADIPCVTTLAGLTAMVQGVEARQAGRFTVRPLQEWHAGPGGRRRREPERPDGAERAPSGVRAAGTGTAS
jgi:carbamoyl-phosphate synthase large subunit